jgi:SAM-dependent methyltransferase
MSLIVNVGCGTRTSSHPDVLNIDWSLYLRIRRGRVLKSLAGPIIGAERRQRLRQLPTNILVHNLRKGIPLADTSADVVYHSHFLEHLDRDICPAFLSEVFRVLRPHGIHRIVVPDLEKSARDYLESLEQSLSDPRLSAEHDESVGRLLEQSVRRQAAGTKDRPNPQKLVESVLLGDARRRGETHQWMYDRVNLPVLLKDSGFIHVEVAAHDESRIPDWIALGLDSEPDGSEYKAGSLYIECERP